MNKQITPSVKINIENLWGAIEEIKTRLDELSEQLDASSPAAIVDRINTIEQVLWGVDE